MILFFSVQLRNALIVNWQCWIHWCWIHRCRCSLLRSLPSLHLPSSLGASSVRASSVVASLPCSALPHQPFASWRTSGVVSVLLSSQLADGRNPSSSSCPEMRHDRPTLCHWTRGPVVMLEVVVAVDPPQLVCPWASCSPKRFPFLPIPKALSQSSIH